MHKMNEIVLWPIYFDSTKTRSEGRKVPKRLGTSLPTLGMIENTLKRLRLSYKSVPDAAYPYFPWIKNGSILVEKRKAKNKILKDVAKELLRLSV